MFSWKSQHWCKRIPEHWVHLHPLGWKDWGLNLEVLVPRALETVSSGFCGYCAWIMLTQTQSSLTLRGTWRPHTFTHFALSPQVWMTKTQGLPSTYEKKTNVNWTLCQNVHKPILYISSLKVEYWKTAMLIDNYDFQTYHVTSRFVFHSGQISGRGECLNLTRPEFVWTWQPRAHTSAGIWQQSLWAL